MERLKGVQRERQNKIKQRDIKKDRKKEMERNKGT